MDNDLQKAIALIKSGQKKLGGQILAEVVKQQPNNESAWLWLTQCVLPNQQKIFCLTKALEINPQNEDARKFIHKLQNDQEQQFQFVDNPPVVSQPVVQFIQANCPYCDGELRVPSNRQNIKCMYCGGDIIVQGNNLIALKPKNTIDHLLTLADAAEKARNYEEAYKYYSQVLEQDSNISIAWIGKGISAGWLSSAQGQRIDEAITCITKGLDSNKGDPNKWVIHAAHSLIHITQAYTSTICEYLTNKYESERSPRSNGVLVDPVTAGFFITARNSAAEKKISNEFWQNYRSIIMRATNYAWNLFPSFEIATGLYNIIKIVKNSVLSSQVKSGFEEGFDETILAIKAKFPQWKPPESKKDCFIATATMGDYDHPYVITLRKYRDENLLHNNFGKAIIQTYYCISPPIAKIIKYNSFLRTLSLYLIIKPSIFLVNLMLTKRERA